MKITDPYELWTAANAAGEQEAEKANVAPMIVRSDMVKDSFGRDWALDDMASRVGQGWRPLIERLYRLCEERGVVVAQVNGRGGGLRFYVVAAPSSVLDVIEAAEIESMTICEECGVEGKLVEIRGWWRTTCGKHE